MTARIRPGSVAWVAIGALVLRVLYLLELRDTPLFAVLIGDAQQYDAWAQRIAGGRWLGTEIFYQTPLYPYLLAVVFLVAGHSLMAVRLLQALLGAASCVLLALAGRRFAGARAGLAAGLLLAVYPPAIFFDGLIQKSSLDLFLVTLLLALLGEFLDRRRWPWLAGAGVALGAFMLNRENARVLYPIVAVWLWWFFRETPARARAAWIGMFTAAVLAVIVPIGLRNYHVGGEFLLSTSQLGPNFYIGNHAGAQGSYEPLVPKHGNVAFEREDATRLAEKVSGRKLSAGEVSDYWFTRALGDIRAQPLGWMRLVGRKLLLTFNAAELVDTESIEVYAEYSRVLGTLFWLDLGIVLPLAAIGVWQTRSDWRRLTLLYAMVGGLALSVALFYVLGRYRYPIVPIVLLFAAAALAAVPRSARAWRQLAPGLAVAAIVAVVARLPLVPIADETYLNLGTALISQGRSVEAIPLLERSAAAAPNYAAPHFNLGVALARTGDKQKSLDQFSAAVRLAPDDFEARSALALALQESGDATNAVAEFGEAARLQPENPRAQFNLANALHVGGQEQDAIAHYETAVRLKPDYAEAHSNLALAMQASGNLAGAIEHLQAAARLQPDSPGIQFNLAALLSDAGRGPEALGHYEQAATLSPDSLDLQYALAQAYGRGNRWQDALGQLQKAAALARAGGRADVVAEIESAIQACRSRLGGRQNEPRARW
jgi:tetratricopeptide (TPR) repeat protein